MSDAIRVRLRVHDAVLHVLEGVGVDAFTARVKSDLEGYLRRIGLSGVPDIAVHGGGTRAVAIAIGETALGFPPSFLTRLWFGIAPEALRGAPTVVKPVAPGGFPDRWVADCSTKVAGSGDRPGCEAISELVARLVLEAVALRPSSLLLAEDTSRVLAGVEHRLGRSEATTILADLLERGVSLVDTEVIRDVAAAALAAGLSAPDALEEVFAHLRARSLEVQMDAGSFAALTSRRHDGGRTAIDGEAVTRDFKLAVDTVYLSKLHELGLRLPVDLVRVDEFKRPEIRLKINDRTSPSIPVPAPDEVALTVSPSLLAERGVTARPLVDPVTGLESSAVAAADGAALAEQGLLVLPHATYLAAAFARAAMPVAFRMVSVDEVEEDLAALEATVPSLVHEVLELHGLGELTRVLRGLVREQVSIRDLRRIVAILVAYSTEHRTDEVVLVDPLPDDGDELTPVFSTWLSPHLLSFLRGPLADRVCHDAGVALDGRPSGVHETDAAFEALVERMLDEDSLEAVGTVLDRVWATLGNTGERNSIIVTSARTRLALQRTIERELPSTHVLARRELPPTARLEPLSAITAGEREPSHV